MWVCAKCGSEVGIKVNVSTGKCVKLLAAVTISVVAGLWLFVEPLELFELSPENQEIGGRLPPSPRGANGFEPIRVLPQHRALTNPPLLHGDDVQDEVRDEELVLGVFVGSEARAYPLNMLCGPSREIVNDTLGGTPIAATW